MPFSLDGRLPDCHATVADLTSSFVIVRVTLYAVSSSDEGQVLHRPLSDCSAAG